MVISIVMKLFVKRFQQLTIDELYAMLHVRSEVFVVEQNCVYQDLDFDDQKSIHVWLADEDGKILAMSRVCPAGAISGSVKEPHVIDTAKCVKCGACIEKCKFGAISKK